MSSRIVIVQGHPDPAPERLCRHLTAAYREGAKAAGHDVRMIDVAALDFPVLRRKTDFDNGTPVPAIREAQDSVRWADHLVIVYPLWLGTMPALLKAFLEQVFRPGFAMKMDDEAGTWTQHLKGKSARIVITMGMPALAYRLYFGAHSLKSLERNILKFSGIKPVRETLFGMVEAATDATRTGWLREMQALGRRGR